MPHEKQFVSSLPGQRPNRRTDETLVDVLNGAQARHDARALRNLADPASVPDVSVADKAACGEDNAPTIKGLNALD